MSSSSQRGRRKTRIAVLGGGLGGLSTAFWLTEQPGWNRSFEITVYQMGWRLGGKGASGRNLTPGYGSRIEEHGLHFFFGFYENAFAMMRRTFADLAEHPSPVRTFTDCTAAFTPHSLAVLPERVNGEWKKWSLVFPPGPGAPGSPDQPADWGWLLRIIIWLQELRQVYSATDSTPGAIREKIVVVLVQGMQRLLGHSPPMAGGSESVVSLLEALAPLAAGLSNYAGRSLRSISEDVASSIERIVERLCATLADIPTDLARRGRILVDLAGTTAVGVLRDELFFRGFESIDDRDFRDWLRQHGARPETLESRLLLAWYHMAFAFEHGDVNRPRAAAGTALLGMIRLLFTYKGAFAYRMPAGMGDTVFAPLYAVLLRRGVQFRFFHRVDRLAVDANDLGLIGEIRLTRQARLRLRSTGSSYWPFVRVEGRDCWPNQPLVDQLAGGRRWRRSHDFPSIFECSSCDLPGAAPVTLRRGRHFDHVVLAIPAGALSRVCSDLTASDLRWRRMLKGDGVTAGLASVATQAMQLWFKDEARNESTQATASIGQHRGLLGGYAPPFDTWGDMTDTLDAEEWSDLAAGRVAYACGVLPDSKTRGRHAHDHGGRLEHLIRKSVSGWLRRAWKDLAPEFLPPTLPTAGNWETLLSTHAEDSSSAGQYFRANVDPADRYVTIAPGTTQLRLRADESGFRNLTLAGDWVRNPVISAGSAEAAVASGMAAARAIAGYPTKIAWER